MQVISRDLVLVFKLMRRKRLDITIVKDVKSFILKNIRKNKQHYSVVLDLEFVDFIDTAAISMLMELNGTLAKSGCDFSITNVSNEMMELVQLAPKLKDLIKDPPLSDNTPSAA